MVNTIQNETMHWKDIGLPPPSIVITIMDNQWEDACTKWLNGENPTESEQWLRGVFAFENPVLKEVQL